MQAKRVVPVVLFVHEGTPIGQPCRQAKVWVEAYAGGLILRRPSLVVIALAIAVFATLAIQRAGLAPALTGSRRRPTEAVLAGGVSKW